MDRQEQYHYTLSKDDVEKAVILYLKTVFRETVNGDVKVIPQMKHEYDADSSSPPREVFDGVKISVTKNLTIKVP